MPTPPPRNTAVAADLFGIFVGGGAAAFFAGTTAAFFSVADVVVVVVGRILSFLFFFILAIFLFFRREQHKAIANMNISSITPNAAQTTIKVVEFLPSPNMAAISSLVVSFVLSTQDCSCSSDLATCMLFRRRSRGKRIVAVAANFRLGGGDPVMVLLSYPLSRTIIGVGRGSRGRGTKHSAMTMMLLRRSNFAMIEIITRVQA